MRSVFLPILLLLSLPSSARSQQRTPMKVIPSTTLREETANNTSAADNFQTQTNGNAAPGNISKDAIRSMLYSGATTRIYAHLMGWFDNSKHMNVGYRSDDPAQVHHQVEDMISRGIDRVMIDWRGSSDSGPTDRTTQLVMKEAERHAGFTFEVSVDPKAIDYSNKSNDATKALIHELKYVAKTYFPSPAYMRIDGRPVLTNFELDKKYQIDWTRVVRQVPGDPLYMFQHASGFDHPFSAGSYSWVGVSKTEHNDWGQRYLDDFYSNSVRKSHEYTIGSVKPGFNDRLASWSLDRVMNRNCGQTWLASFAEINKFYSRTNQLPALQIVTWNDYEEGTEIESGIENCAIVSARINGDDLKWNISGRETTRENSISHYVVFISIDGQNLMPLASVPMGVHELELGNYKFAPGKYTLYVKAVGVASIRNHISDPITYVIR